MSDDDISLKPTKVRWFYRDDYAKKWVPFNGYDSINIELNYLRLLKMNAVLKDSNNNHEEIEKSERLLVRDGLYEVSVINRRCYPVYWETSDGPAAILRGTWFKDPGGPYCAPIDDESMVEQLELAHACLALKLSEEGSFPPNNISKLESSDATGIDNSFAITSIFSTSSRPMCVHTLRFADCHVDWYSLDEIYLYVESATSYIRQKLGMQKVGTRLGRGYFEEADISTAPPTFTHLCFVVHGIGQKACKDRIVKSCDVIRETSRKLIDSYFPDVRASGHQIEFLPVEWRSSLRLDGNIVDSITLENLTRLRTFLNWTFMDIMYYSSPLYRYEINQSLRRELNRLYCLFCERHPYFEPQGGKVSIMAHSLGCVIAYDLITGWIEPVPHHLQPSLSVEKKESNSLACTTDSDDEDEGTCKINSNDEEDPAVLLAKLEAAKEVVKCLETLLERRQLSGYADESSSDSHSLLFASRLENLFCIGSPLPVYLTLRGVRPGQTGSTESILPSSKCLHIYNVFHPADPVAYRLEPLLLKRYSSIPPMDIYRCTDPSKIPYNVVHALSNTSSPAASPSPPLGQDFMSSRIFYENQAGNNNTSILSSYPTFEFGTSSIESFNFMSSQLRRRVSLPSFMFGFFRNNLDSEPQASLPQISSPGKISAKRAKPSSPCRESTRSRFSVHVNEILEGTSESAVTFHLPPTSHSVRSSSTDSGMSAQTLDYRIDFQLKENRYEPPYLSALTVHTSYWSNSDIVMFVLMQCHPNSMPLDNPMTPL